jgi:hypothetical protein
MGKVERLPVTGGKAASPPVESRFDDVRSAMEIVLHEGAAVEYCVPGRVPSGLVIIGARPKFKKSWWALQLAIAKASGGEFMGVRAAEGRALCLFLEDNDRRMSSRFEFLGIKADRDSFPHFLHIAYDWPTGALGVEKLHRWMESYPDTKLIVVDVLQRFRGPRDKYASVYEADYSTMAMLHGLTQSHLGLTVLVVHHVKKGAVDDPIEALNGSFGIAGAADAFIILRRGPEKDQVIAHIDGRDWESWDHEFAWEFRPSVGWVQLGISDGDLTATQQEILRFARDNEHVTPSTLAKFRQISRPTAHEALQALVSKGVMRVYGGKYYPNGAV